MFSKRRFRRRNKPSSQHFLESGEQQQETPFIPPVQTKLNIGKPGDIYEVEADKTADAVVAKTNSPETIQKMGAEEEEVQTKPLAAGLTPFVQKQETAEEEESVQAMAEKEEEEPVQMQEEEEEVQAKEDEEEVQPKSNDPNIVGNGLSSQLNNSKGGGVTMDKSTKSEMEQAFGTDFSHVNIHTDAKAKAMNKELNAQAFTHGKDIYFNSGKYNPETKKGKHLLAHELTHTIQQGAIGAKQAEGTNLRNTSNTVQKEDKDDGSLSWSDYEVIADNNSQHSAITAVDLELKPLEDLVNMSWNSEGSTITVTIDYRPSVVEIIARMDTKRSSKEKWITDDEAAKAKLGHDNIDQARSDLLDHEQVHFNNAVRLAEKYNTLVKEAVPTTAYTETFTASSKEEIDLKSAEIARVKLEELTKILKKIRRSGSEELGELQGIYDLDTDHGRKSEQQENWQNDFDKAMEEAKNPESVEQEKEEPNIDE